MSRGDVSYSCGACGYPLNLSSSQRTGIDARYPKVIKKGKISFLCIDESRFKQLDEVKCQPYFQNMASWGLYRCRTKLLCGNCGKIIGHGHEDDVREIAQDNDNWRLSDSPDGSDTSSGGGTPNHKKYCVKIKALQPLLDQDLLCNT